jgi:Xaa-Pro dipeptidase
LEKDPNDLDLLYSEHVAALEGKAAPMLAEEGWDAIAIHSGSLRPRSVYDDQFWPLRTCPHFQHWLPLAEPDALLIVRPGRTPLLVRVDATGFWEKPALPESEAFMQVMDVVHVAEVAKVREHMGPGRVAFVGEDAGKATAFGVPPEAACPPALLGRLDAMRTLKTPYEVACIAEANRRARAGHEALREAFRSGDASELDLHLCYLRATAQDDWETPYKNIVALGAHAATLHHVAYGRLAQARDAESLLVDAGATCRGYAADVTRTWCKGRTEASAAFARLVSGVEAMQQRLCASVRAGLPYEQLHEESHREAARVLRDVGLARSSGASIEALVAGGVTRAFYPHGLGHSLGLQTHDVGCGLRAPRAENPFLRNTSDVTVGQVFTIEPGIYFIDALMEELRQKPEQSLIDWSVVELLEPLGGVRIEDDVHVATTAGVTNLTRTYLPAQSGAVD